MLAGAAEKYAHAFGVACGQRVVIAANSDSAYRRRRVAARCGRERGRARRPPRRAPISAADAAGLTGLASSRRGIVKVVGSLAVRGCTSSSLDARRARADDLRCDAILSAGGHAPAVHLHSQAGGKLRWLEESAMFVPDGRRRDCVSVGACAGVFARDAALEHAAQVGEALARGRSAPVAPVGGAGRSLAATHAGRSVVGKAIRRFAERRDPGRCGARGARELSLRRASQALYDHRHGHRSGQDQQRQCAGLDGRVHRPRTRRRRHHQISPAVRSRDLGAAGGPPRRRACIGR